MIRVYATVALLAITVLCMTLSGKPAKRGKHARKEASPVLSTYGMDARGRVWRVCSLEGRAVRMYVDGRVYLAEGGPRTFRRVTSRNGISWEC